MGPTWKGQGGQGGLALMLGSRWTPVVRRGLRKRAPCASQLSTHWAAMLGLCRPRPRGQQQVPAWISWLWGRSWSWGWGKEDGGAEGGISRRPGADRGKGQLSEEAGEVWEEEAEPGRGRQRDRRPRAPPGRGRLSPHAQDACRVPSSPAPGIQPYHQALSPGHPGENRSPLSPGLRPGLARGLAFTGLLTNLGRFLLTPPPWHPPPQRPWSISATSIPLQLPWSQE